MKTKQLISTSLCAIILCSPLLAGDEGGAWWKTLTPTQKYAYANGWWHGLYAAERIIGGVTGQPEYKQAVSRFVGMTNAQISQGIDEFYAADYRNMPIFAGDAALVVCMAARGLPQKEIERMIIFLRSHYTDGFDFVPDKSP